jgi:biotin transport system substrate-specific component
MHRNALALTLLPTRTIARDLGLAAGGAALTAACAQVSVPWQPVPFTLQTLAVTLCGLTMGARIGTMSQVAYIAAGMAGAPVFAGGAAGPQHLFGPTGGYLVAFVAAAGLLGWLAEKGWTRSGWLTAAALAVGNVLILALGATWLSVFTGAGAAWTLGVAPFVSGAVAKSAVVALCLPQTWRFVREE